MKELNFAIKDGTREKIINDGILADLVLSNFESDAKDKLLSTPYLIARV